MIKNNEFSKNDEDLSVPKTAFLRLMNDQKKIEDKASESFSATPITEDLMEWEAAIFGPDDTMWEGGIFELKLIFSEEYPNEAPEI